MLATPDSRDAHIVELARRGALRCDGKCNDELKDALEDWLISGNGERIKKFINARTSDLDLSEQQEDLFQDTLLHMIRGICNGGYIPDLKPLISYTLGIASNRIKRACRIRKTSGRYISPVELIDESIGIEWDDPAILIDEQDEMDYEIQRIRKEFGPGQWTILKMKYVDEYSDQEIACSLSMKPDAVRQRLSRCKRKICYINIDCRLISIVTELSYSLETPGFNFLSLTLIIQTKLNKLIK